MPSRLSFDSHAFPSSDSGIIKNIAGFKAGRHIIFYRQLETKEVEITRILHEQMDLKNRIFEE